MLEFLREMIIYQVIKILSLDHEDKLNRWFGCVDDSHGSNGCWDEAGDSWINLQIMINS